HTATSQPHCDLATTVCQLDHCLLTGVYFSCSVSAEVGPACHPPGERGGFFLPPNLELFRKKLYRAVSLSPLDPPGRMHYLPRTRYAGLPAGVEKGALR